MILTAKMFYLSPYTTQQILVLQVHWNKKIYVYIFFYKGKKSFSESIPTMKLENFILRLRNGSPSPFKSQW